MSQTIPSTRVLAAADLSADEMYLMLRDSVVPRPIAWVSTIDATGRTNLAPYSFFNVCSPDPPVLGFSVGPRGDKFGTDGVKDTLANVRETGEMVVNIVPEGLALQMVDTSAHLPPGQSEFAFAGLAELPSTTVRPPRVAGAPIAYECRLHDIIRIGHHHWVMGRVEHIHLDERIYLGEQKGQRHRIDLTRLEDLRPIGRLGRAHYLRMRGEETLIRRDGPNE